MSKSDCSDDDSVQRPVLVVEDEFLIALMVESFLKQRGYDDVVMAQSLEDGLLAARTHQLAFAILDVNLQGMVSFPIADVLRSRDIPFGFQTAYGRDGVASDFDDCPVVVKPFDQVSLGDLIDDLQCAAGSC